jgi:hypothetical protein
MGERRATPPARSRRALDATRCGAFTPNLALWEANCVALRIGLPQADQGRSAPAEPIPDLDQAAKNALGTVDYAAQIMLIMRADRVTATARS